MSDHAKPIACLESAQRRSKCEMGRSIIKIDLHTSIELRPCDVNRADHRKRAGLTDERSSDSLLAVGKMRAVKRASRFTLKSVSHARQWHRHSCLWNWRSSNTVVMHLK